MTEWVEVSGTTVDVAVEAAVAELGLESKEQAQIDVIQEPKPGFLGVGSRPAIVKVSRKPRKRNRRGRRGAKNKSGSSSQKSSQKKTQAKPQQKKSSDRKPRNGKGSRTTGGQKAGESKKNGSPKERRPMDTNTSKEAKQDKDKPEYSIEDQAKVAEEFLSGLLGSFGLEGEIGTRVEDEVLYLDVSGDQTEALVGPKGSTMHAVLELTRTTVQRRTFGAPRMRIDIAGYGARRREALTIYTGKLVEQLKENGGEVMLEPMNAADRKVVHDAAASFGGVRTYSEGEDPRRAVVIAATGDASD